MKSKNKAAPTKAEAAYIEAVKELPCAVCDTPGPSECHEPEQGLWFASIALCPACHRHPIEGWHGQRQAWKLRRMSELQAIAKTAERVMKEKGLLR